MAWKVFSCGKTPSSLHAFINAIALGHFILVFSKRAKTYNGVFGVCINIEYWGKIKLQPQPLLCLQFEPPFYE
jgi:hypothetical protein